MVSPKLMTGSCCIIVLLSRDKMILNHVETENHSMRIGVLQCGHETSWVNTHMFGVTITMDDAGNAL